MFMSLFFFIPTVLLYGLCHWVAKNTRPGDTRSFDNQLLMNWTVSETGEAVEAWIHKKPRMKITSKEPGKILVEQRPSIFSFGAFYEFNWASPVENNDETSLLNAKIQPKLIQTTTEKTSFTAQLKRNLESMLIKNSDENVDFNFKSSK